MKSVLFFIVSLGDGGAEGILANTVKLIDKTKFNIDVAATVDTGWHTETVKKYCKFRSFTCKKFGKLLNKVIIKSSLIMNPEMVRRFFVRKKYDVEIAFCEGYATKIIGNSPYKSKKIAWVHTDVINNPWSESIFGSAEKEKECYEKFDAIICVSQTMKDSFVKKYGMENKVFVLYNVIDTEKIISYAKEELILPTEIKPVFSMVGRLVPVKGYERVIDVFHRLKLDGYNFSVVILGDGSEENKLNEKIKEYKLEENIFLMGFCSNPYKYIQKADALICSSFAEGYSTVVCEAIILGTPVITTLCSGMKEIFDNSECGIICENSEQGLYDSIKSVLDCPNQLDYFSQKAKQRSVFLNEKERIAQIENFIENI